MSYDDEVFKVKVNRGAEAFSDSSYVVVAKTAREAVMKVFSAKPGLDEFVGITVELSGGELID